MRLIDIYRSILEQDEPPHDCRLRLPDCRRCETVTFEFENARREKAVYEATFGLDENSIIREVFCNVGKTGTDLQGLVNDACITLSIALQFGARIGALANSMGELVDEMDPEARPASILGAIARAGAWLETEMAGGQP